MTSADTREKELRLRVNDLETAIREYLSEMDNPVPDGIMRRTLRDRLRQLVKP
jgi:hypothetical protein